MSGRGCLPGLPGVLALAFVLALSPARPVSAEDGAPRSSFAMSERSDWSRYSDGRYIGHVYRESRAWFSGEAASGLRGEVYALEGNLQGSASTAREVASDAGIDIDLGRFGVVGRSSGSSFPSHRGLLAGAPARIEAGSTWISEAELALQPREGGPAGVIRVLVEYRFAREGRYGDRPVTIVTALFAPRWKASVPHNATLEAEGLRSVTGRHDLELYLDSADGSLVFLRDRFDDTFVFSSGPAERRSGFILVFAQGSRAQDRRAELAAIARAGAAQAAPPSALSAPASTNPPSALPGAAGSGGTQPSSSSTGSDRPTAPLPASLPTSPEAPPASPVAGPGPLIAGSEDGLDEAPSPALAAAGVEVLSAGDKLVLRVRDLRFVADGDAILPGEEWRLDAIYEALAALPGRSFLVEGHSAGVGKPSGELELSKRRAKRVVDELSARGIDAGRLIWRGLGSTKPLAPNDSEAGRARNRRVEITVLE